MNDPVISVNVDAKLALNKYNDMQTRAASAEAARVRS